MLSFIIIRAWRGCSLASQKEHALIHACMLTLDDNGYCHRIVFCLFLSKSRTFDYVLVYFVFCGMVWIPLLVCSMVCVFGVMCFNFMMFSVFLLLLISFVCFCVYSVFCGMVWIPFLVYSLVVGTLYLFPCL